MYSMIFLVEVLSVTNKKRKLDDVNIHPCDSGENKMQGSNETN